LGFYGTYQYFPERGMLRTDNEGQFNTKKWNDFAKRAEIEIVKMTPYNPVERVMREIGRVIRT